MNLTSPTPSSKYAKIIIDDNPTLPSDIPSFKVLMHEQLAATATDSIEGSTILAKEISKSLVVDLLKSKENTKKFGILLGDILKFDSILEPTRALIYWSINTQTSMLNLERMSSNGLAQYLAYQPTLAASSNWMKNFIKDKYFIDQLSLPYFTWLLPNQDYCIQPVVNLIVYFLPRQKVQLSYFLSY